MDREPSMFDLYASSVVEVALHHGDILVVPDGVEPLGDGFVSVPSPFRGDCGWVITAWNPRSTAELSLEQNRERNHELYRLLGEVGASVVDAVGRSRSGDVAEESFYCTGLGRGIVLGLADKYEQNAVFHLDADRIAVVGVLIDEQRSTRYSVWARAEVEPAGDLFLAPLSDAHGGVGRPAQAN